MTTSVPPPKPHGHFVDFDPSKRSRLNRWRPRDCHPRRPISRSLLPAARSSLVALFRPGNGNLPGFPEVSNGLSIRTTRISVRRMGFAYQLPSNGRYGLRGGYGIFFGPAQHAALQQPVVQHALRNAGHGTRHSAMRLPLCRFRRPAHFRSLSAPTRPSSHMEDIRLCCRLRPSIPTRLP